MDIAKTLNAAIFDAKQRTTAVKSSSKFKVTYYREDGKTYACSSTFPSRKAAQADVDATRAAGGHCSDPVNA